jgi:hypothetical protein
MTDLERRRAAPPTLCTLSAASLPASLVLVTNQRHPPSGTTPPNASRAPPAGRAPLHLGVRRRRGLQVRLDRLRGRPQGRHQARVQGGHHQGRLRERVLVRSSDEGQHPRAVRPPAQRLRRRQGGEVRGECALSIDQNSSATCGSPCYACRVADTWCFAALLRGPACGMGCSRAGAALHRRARGFCSSRRGHVAPASTAKCIRICDVKVSRARADQALRPRPMRPESGRLGRDRRRPGRSRHHAHLLQRRFQLER